MCDHGHTTDRTTDNHHHGGALRRYLLLHGQTTDKNNGQPARPWRPWKRPPKGLACGRDTKAPISLVRSPRLRAPALLHAIEFSQPTETVWR